MSTATLALALIGSQASSASAARGLDTGIAEALYVFSDAQRTVLFDETAEANAGIVRLWADWRTIAGVERPADPANPADPSYDFSQLDAATTEARVRGLDVVMMILRAPDWAEGQNRQSNAVAGSWKPSPADLGDFSRALASRYSGEFVAGDTTLPMVTKFQVWNEPNLPESLSPQYAGERAVAAEFYRRMLNSAYAAVKSVSPRNLVVTAGTAPYGDPPGGPRTRPVAFLRDLLCLEGRKQLKRGPCTSRAKFDVLDHHPINLTGGPLDSARSPDDAAFADLDEIRRVLRAAERRGTTATGGRHPLWVTEFWWASDPPFSGPSGVPLRKHARWYEQALYEVWRQGASVAMILQVRDTSYPTGILFEDGTRKPAFQAFRFPFVVDSKSDSKALAWTRPPASGRLTIERLGEAGWRPIARIDANRSRVVTKQIDVGKGARLRATVAGEHSLPWVLK